MDALFYHRARLRLFGRPLATQRPDGVWRRLLKLGTILSGFCNDFWTLLACRVLVGLGEASFAVLAPAWLADLFPAARRNNAMTIFYVAMPIGAALGYIVGGAALAYGGWRTSFWWRQPGCCLC